MVVGVPAKISGSMSDYGGVVDFSSGDTAADDRGHQHKKISDSEARRVK
jgi:hypothetical protein